MAGKKKDDEAKRKILGRRARFVAAALAGVATEACGTDATPAPVVVPAPTETAPPYACLSVRADAVDAGDDPSAAPCLSLPPPPASPQPCLDIAMPDPPPAPDAGSPQPCLKIAPPGNRKKK